MPRIRKDFSVVAVHHQTMRQDFDLFERFVIAVEKIADRMCSEPTFEQVLELQKKRSAELANGSTVSRKRIQK